MNFKMVLLILLILLILLLLIVLFINIIENKDTPLDIKVDIDNIVV